MTPELGLPVPCVGAIVRDGTGRLLLVQRGGEPERGRWSLPGGRVEPGETDETAVARELLEETGLTVRVGPLVGRVLRPGTAGRTYAIADYACTVAAGELAAGDDAAAVRWCGPVELAGLPLAGGLLETLTSWGVLPT